MLVPFESLPPSSRIWIYQSDKSFNSTQRQILSELLSAFTESWTAHGNPMKASFQLPHDHFIILAADEHYAEASGCSIDDSVRTIRAASERTRLNFLDRTTVAFKKGESIDLVAINDLKSGLSEGKWNADTLVFNNLVSSAGQLSEWVVPARSTWLKRYLSQQPVAN